MIELMHLIDLFTAGEATDADNSSVKVCFDPMLLSCVFSINLARKSCV